MFPMSLQPGEMIVIMLVAVLLFGKRLPEVGRSLGKGIVEFKKGLRGVDDDDLEPTSSPSVRRAETAALPAMAEPAVPKFEPPPATPVVEVSSPAATSSAE
jgi:sec-independent protein translocase protein TatA